MSLKYAIDNTSRISSLRKLLKKKGFLRIIEVHNGLSALIASSVSVTLQGGKELSFDGFWESSLTDSASKGMPDIEVVSIDSRLETINQILEVTDKPLIVDGDTGGDFNQFEYTVKRLERAGVSMVIIEDKIFPKRNSLQEGSKQDLEKVEIFAEKIKRGQKIKRNPDFMIVARLESLIAGHSLEEALERAKAFLEAGADGIMIHSKSSDPKDIFEFAKRFYLFPKKLIAKKILVCVPTTYNTVTAKELAKKGFHIIIHANHMLRAAYKGMADVSQQILQHDRSFEVDANITPVKKVFEKVGFLDVTKKDKEMENIFRSKIKAIIPAAGENDLTKEYALPVSLIKIGKKTILERQIKALSKASIDNICLIRGYKSDKFAFENITYLDNKTYKKFHLLHSFFLAEKQIDGPFVYINGDIIFKEDLIQSLLTSAVNNPDADIILVVDNSYQFHKPNDTKKLDLVRSDKGENVMDNRRDIHEKLEENVLYIGKKLDPQIARYEFIGIAYFSPRGARILKDVYNKIKKSKGRFQEASSVSQASFTDIIQEIIERKYPVKVMKTYKGWMEIHSKADVKNAERLLSK